jgi:hypothetical protein
VQSAFATEAAFFVAAEWTGWIEILLPLSVRFVRSYNPIPPPEKRLDR